MIPLIIKTNYKKDKLLTYFFLYELGLYLEDIGHDNIFFHKIHNIDFCYSKQLKTIKNEEIKNLSKYNILTWRLTSDICENIDKINKIYIYVSPYDTYQNNLSYFYYWHFYNIPFHVLDKISSKIIFIQDKNKMTYDYTQSMMFKSSKNITEFTWGIYDKYFIKNIEDTINNDKILVYIDNNKNFLNILDKNILKEMYKNQLTIYYNRSLKNLEQHIFFMSKTWSTYKKLICLYNSNNPTTLPYRFSLCDKESVLLQKESTIDDFVFQLKKPSTSLKLLLSDFQ